MSRYDFDRLQANLDIDSASPKSVLMRLLDILDEMERRIEELEAREKGRQDLDNLTPPSPL